MGNDNREGKEQSKEIQAVFRSESCSLIAPFPTIER